MDDLLSEFLVESIEALGQLDNELVILEREPTNQGILQSIFRTMHTIKGTCGFIGLPKLEAVTHSAENVLGKIREGKISVSPDIISIILESVDVVKVIFNALSTTGQEPNEEYKNLIARLDHIYHGVSGPVPAVEVTRTQEAAAQFEAPSQMVIGVEQREKVDSASVEEASLQPTDSTQSPPSGGGMRFDECAIFIEDGESTPAQITLQHVGEEVREEIVHSTAYIPEAIELPPVEDKSVQKTGGAAPEGGDLSIANQTIRVNVRVLENLMTKVSELVLTRNQLVQTFRNIENADVGVSLHRLNHVTSELQEEVMKTRMQPIGNAWTKIPRLVRDLCQETKSKIDVEMIGADTELDRQIIELIKDPITHMVRNSADHGIESPKDRVKAGKPETGKIVLKAYHAGGHVIIEISDDGKGLSSEKIIKKAIANGLTTQESIRELSETQIYQFIFKPGFSTAEAVTHISGRGVGMDVVRSNVEKIGGTIDIKSQEGKGTIFSIKIPLTLAIVSALVADVDGYKFAIPQLCVLELVKVAEHTDHKIELIHNRPVLRLRNRLLPLISLKDLFYPQDADKDHFTAEKYNNSYIIVLQVGADTFGVIVSQVYDTQEIVVKPVSGLLRHLTIFGGNTILGDGSVIMILDPNGIATHLGQRNLMDDLNEQAAAELEKKKNIDKDIFLLFYADDQTPKTVPLSTVTRLEQIEVKNIQFSDGKARMRYFDSLIPILSLSGQYNFQEGEEKPVLIFTKYQYTMGIIVDTIVDIIEDEMNVQLGSTQNGKLGSFILNEQVVDIIDTEYYFNQAYPNWSHQRHFDRQQKQRIAYIGDISYSVGTLTPLLQVDGYDVDKFDNLEEALKYLKADDRCCSIIIDTESPCKDYIAEKVSIDLIKRITPVPILVLTDEEGGNFTNDYENVTVCDKFNRHDLVRKLVSFTRDNPIIVSKYEAGA